MVVKCFYSNNVQCAIFHKAHCTAGYWLYEVTHREITSMYLVLVLHCTVCRDMNTVLSVLNCTVYGKASAKAC